MTMVFPRAAMTSALVLLPITIASLALSVEMALARLGVIVAVGTVGAPGKAHPATQAQKAYATPARNGVFIEAARPAPQWRAPPWAGAHFRRPYIQTRSGCHPASCDRPAAYSKCDRAEPGSRNNRGHPLTRDHG